MGWPDSNREQHPIDDPKPRLTARPLEDSELVAEDEDLEVLGTVIVATDWETEETSEHPDEERQEEQHRRIPRCALIVDRGFRPPRGDARWVRAPRQPTSR